LYLHLLAVRERDRVALEGVFEVSKSTAPGITKVKVARPFGEVLSLGVPGTRKSGSGRQIPLLNWKHSGESS